MHTRPIQQKDNPTVAHIIRSVMTEFGAVGTGFSIEDPEVDAMYEAYSDERTLFLVVANEQDEAVGCAGIAPLLGGDAGTCELKKMYFLPVARGKGMGRTIILALEKAAIERGFQRMYLETIASMQAANHIYQALEFEQLPGKLGNTGHSACGLFYAKSLVKG